jgi:hypothetical protein
MRRGGGLGQAISPLIDRITDIQSDAEFILLVEKDAAFNRLSEDRFYNTYPCIIVTVRCSGLGSAHWPRTKAERCAAGQRPARRGDADGSAACVGAPALACAH